MNRQPTLSASVTLPGQGRVLRAFGDELTVLLTGEQTGGPDMNPIVQIAGEHGIHFIQP